MSEKDHDAYEFADFIKVLMSDVDLAGDLARMTGHPAARRAFARAVFAWVEGNVSHLRSTLLAVCHDLIPPGELAVLNEQTFDLDSRGRVVIREKYTRTESALRLAFRLAATHLGSGYQLDVGGQGWGAFKRSVKVRNRVTHPKSRVDLEISDDELDDLREVMRWSCVELGKLWQEVMANHPGRPDDFDERKRTAEA